MALLCCLAALGAGMASWGVIMAVSADRAEEVLSAKVVSDSDASGDPDEGVAGEPRVDWEALRGTSPSVVAWLVLPSRDISLPVSQASEDDPDLFLDHGPDGAYNSVGTPFLDADCSVGDERATVYGHNMHGGTVAFSRIADTWKQDAFDSLGELLVLTPGEVGEDGRASTKVTRMRPAFAQVTSERDRRLTTFDGELGGWLSSMASTAAVKAELPLDGVKGELTLVTCSAPIPGQPERCAITFVE